MRSHSRNIISMTPKIGIIIGSTRPGRIGEQISQWVLRTMSATGGLELVLIDLAKINLPFLNEPAVPASVDPANYVYEHTKSWSKQISELDGYVFVTPEYNGGYPAPLKNAIDTLYKEWMGKPGIIVSYGMGGGKSASAQLRKVLEGPPKMKIVATAPAIVFDKAKMNDSHHYKNPDDGLSPFKIELIEATTQLKKHEFK
eukprot:NODE_179_length_13932_cov_0.652064.p8 type:complete len:200 gc:universal NODE_179_length_13932_cov_0.652064:6695-7294(+)